MFFYEKWMVVITWVGFYAIFFCTNRESLPQDLGNIFCNFLVLIGPLNIFHHEVFSTTRYFPNTDIFGRKQFSTQRHSWLHLFWPSRHFPPWGIFYAASILIDHQLPKHEKVEKRVSHHCSDRITYIRLIQNKSLTPIPHK